MEIATDRILSAVTEPAGGGPQPPFMKGEFHMHLKSTDHRPGNRSGTNVHPSPDFFGAAGAAATTAERMGGVPAASNTSRRNGIPGVPNSRTSTRSSHDDSHR